MINTQVQTKCTRLHEVTVGAYLSELVLVWSQVEPQLAVMKEKALKGVLDGLREIRGAGWRARKRAGNPPCALVETRLRVQSVGPWSGCQDSLEGVGIGVQGFGIRL